MQRALSLILAAAALGVLPVAAGAAPLKDTLPCFLRSDLRNHTVGDAHTLYQEVSGQGVYRIVMSNACLAGAVSSDPIVLRDQAGMGRICKPIELDVSVRGTHCIAQSLTRLTPAEAAALPKKVRP